MGGPFETVLYEKKGAVAHVVLNRPAAMNAFNIQMRDDLWEVLTAVEADPEVRVVLLSGAGERGFCAGADLHEFGTAPSQDAARRARRSRDVFGRLARLPKPAVAALHGHVIGSGVELALLCDIRVASDDAVFRMPETSLGLIPAAGGTQTLPWVIGLAGALDLILTGRELDAAGALKAGLVHTVVPRDELLDEASRVAARLADLKPAAAAGAKGAMAAARDGDLHHGLAVEARIALAVASGTAP